MKRINLNFIVDVVAFIGFVALTTTGVLMRLSCLPEVVTTQQSSALIDMNGVAFITTIEIVFWIDKN